MRIAISEYSPLWPKIFDDEAALLARQLPGSAVIEHIGSTAVPGLAAKPVIDILIGLADFAQANSFVPRIEQLGYEYVPQYETEMPFRRFFRKEQSGVRTHHIHMVAIGTDFWQRHLRFRDYLRTHPETAAQYAALKHTLAARDWQDMNEYADAKTDFIRSVEAEAARQCEKS
ncbi:MAG TPA: GrpB family protein [Pirellulales bacterium]|jgi:GrpB-like predicted nucleotidyltransferase (UPF0157 family)|nr:GrpB family protein [Pirellulales bacterium]